MWKAMTHRAAHRRGPHLATLFATLLTAAACLGLAPAADAGDDETTARDLTVEQTSVFSLQAPLPAATAADGLNVVAWVDHADNTYAIGEAVRLFVRANKDAYLTVLNVGPTGNMTLLFPNTFQKDPRVGANQIVEIPAQGSGASIRASGPSVGRELIKVIASTSPQPLFEAASLTGAGPFSVVSTGGRSVARDLQVTLDAATEHQWDDYNKVITTIASRPMAAVLLATAPADAQTAAMPANFWVATDRSQYQLGEAVSIYARAAEPCYLTLINVGPSGQARVLLPNAAHPQNLLPGGQTVVFPGVSSSLRLTPMGPAGIETVTGVCSPDNRPVVAADLSYGRSGFALVGEADGSAARDLAVVAAAPARQLTHMTVGFVVTQ